MSAIVVQNRLNSPTNGNTPSFVVLKLRTGHRHQYITRPIVLDNQSTALEIRLTSNIRSSSEVEVYFRTSSKRRS